MEDCTLHQALAGQELLGLPDLKCDLLGILDNTVLLEFKPTTFTFSWFIYVTKKDHLSKCGWAF